MPPAIIYPEPPDDLPEDDDSYYGGSFYDDTLDGFVKWNEQRGKYIVVARYCDACHGEGVVSENEYECDWINFGDDLITCPACGGDGIINYDDED